MLDVTPRGAIFTLAALGHVGHPAHLALLDAYLKGQIRLTPSTGIGEDAGIVLSSLAAPLVAAHELRMERLSLADLVLLPRSLSSDDDERRSADDGPVRGPDSPRVVLRSPRGPVWVQAAEWFELAGCAGTPRPGETSPWHDVIVSLPRRPSTDDWFGGDLSLPPVEAELREATAPATPSDVLVASLRALAYARWARAATPLRRAAAEALRAIDAERHDPPRGLSQEIGHELHAVRTSTAGRRIERLGDLLPARPTDVWDRSEATLAWRGLAIDACLVPDLDGYRTLCLLPPAADDPSALFETMRDLAWEAIEGLIGKPLLERRTEPIALRLVAGNGRTTTLDVGISVVIGRNQAVFAAWVGSDGRVMLKLLPPGGMLDR
jgi:hypothetical protein